MISFENFVKSMPPSLPELKLTPSFCFAFKIPDNVTATRLHIHTFGIHAFGIHNFGIHTFSIQYAHHHNLLLIRNHSLIFGIP